MNKSEWNYLEGNKLKVLIRTAIILFWVMVIVAFSYSSLLWFFYDGRKSINVCAWSGMFDLQLIAAFEKETGIRVNLSYYESNEELYLRLGTTERHGYDLIIPSDYAVHYLKHKEMLKKIDTSKLFFYSKLNSLLLSHYFDEQNEYSVPFEWAIYVIGLNKICYEGEPLPESWALIFDKNYVKDHKIVMTNDPLVAIPIAAFYLYQSLDLSKQRIEAIKTLLTRQHPWVVAYSDFRAGYYLASKNASIAVSSSSYILKRMREFPSIDFIIPKEGTLATIESFAIPKSSNKDELVYEFMNFMMKPHHVAMNYEHLGFFPATVDALHLLKLDPKARALLTMTKREFERFHLLRYDRIKHVLREQELQDLWVRVKV